MRKLLFTLTFLVAFVASAFAQAVKLSANVRVTELQANPAEALEYLKGLSIDADARIFEKEGYRLGGVFSYQRTFNQTVFHDYPIMIDPLPPAMAASVTPTSFDIQRNVNAYFIGVQLSKKFGPVEPFASFLLGFSRPHENLDYQVIRDVGAGVDVFFYKESHFFVRPLFVRFKAAGNGDRTTEYGAGVGFRF